MSQFSGEDVTVSVTARNIVGRSNSSVSRSLSEFSTLCLDGSCVSYNAFTKGGSKTYS